MNIAPHLGFAHNTNCINYDRKKFYCTGPSWSHLIDKVNPLNYLVESLEGSQMSLNSPSFEKNLKVTFYLKGFLPK
jgi:hypothetical protein